jgi:hypothetical protein
MGQKKSAFFPELNATELLGVKDALRNLKASRFWRQSGFPAMECYSKLILQEKQ